MQLRCDLHTHSTASDGTLSPTALVERAHEQQVELLALTDHDITSGLSEAANAAAHYGMQFVPGIEISVTWQHQTVHIVGLGIDPHNATLQQGLAQQLAFRCERGAAIAERLEQSGIPGALAGAQRYAGGKILSRTHFAHFLVEQGKAKDIRQVFKKYLVRGKPGYVPGQWATLEQALDWVTAAEGMAVIAHPARYGFTTTKLRKLIGEFRELGGMGFEVISGSHSHDEEQRMAQLAKQERLLVSKGSDFHGPDNAYRELGAMPPVPAGCTPIWHSEQWQQRMEMNQMSGKSV